MKHKGRGVDFTHQRNDELMKAFRRALAKCSFIDLHEVCEVTANTPCSRFWVSEERATIVVSAIIKGKPILETMKPNKREMFSEIHRRTLELRQYRPNDSLFNVVWDVVNSPAPKFYLTTDSVLQTIWKIKKGHYSKR